MNTREECGKRVRPLFEKAALAHYEGGAIAGQYLGEAQEALYICIGIPYDVLEAMSECERWFSFFGLWYSNRLIVSPQYCKPTYPQYHGSPLLIIKDLEESFSPERALALGITADYGEKITKKLRSLIKAAKDALVDGDMKMAALYTNSAADLQYSLAVERAGIPL